MTVRLVFIGHDRSYELIHIVREAFSDVSFTEDGDPDMTVISKADKNGITTVISSAEGREEYTYPFSDTHRGVTGLGHGVCISFLNCAIKFGCRDIPWGALIGIRPSKMILNFKNAGYSDEETKKILSEEYLIGEEKYYLMKSAADYEEALDARMEKNGFCVYIGIPYCPTRCAYCSFISRACPDRAVLDEYLQKLISEISVMKKFPKAAPRAIYIGGGTPTTLSAEQLDKLLEAVRGSINQGKLSEFTVEAGRPDTVTSEKLLIMKEAGVGRISINPQTLNDKTLEAIGRRHTVRDFYDAYEAAEKTGFEIINTDLIAGLPGETVRDFEKSLSGILELSPENITIHTLAKKRAADIISEGENDGRAKKMHSAASAMLEGYKPYYLYRQKNTADNLENIGYCREGAECIYNMCMMGDMRTVISFGAGGVTKKVGENGIKRIRNPKDADWYMKITDSIIKEKEKELGGQING